MFTCMEEGTRDVLAAASALIERATMRRSATDAIVVACKPVTASVFLTALSALAKAIGVRGFETVAEWKWEDAPAFVHQLCERIWEWEDRPGRTTTHVLHALDRAMEEA